MLYEKYRESVLVPPISTLEDQFKYEKSFIESLIKDTKNNKSEAFYEDSMLKVQRKESSTHEKENGKDEDEDVDIERRSDSNEEEKKSDREDENNGKISPPNDPTDDPEPEPEPARPRIEEDEWICEQCDFINKNNNSRCKKCHVKNEVIEMMREAQREERRWERE